MSDHVRSIKTVLSYPNGMSYGIDEAERYRYHFPGYTADVAEFILDHSREDVEFYLVSEDGESRVPITIRQFRILARAEAIPDSHRRP